MYIYQAIFVLFFFLQQEKPHENEIDWLNLHKYQSKKHRY